MHVEHIVSCDYRMITKERQEPDQGDHQHDELCYSRGEPEEKEHARTYLAAYLELKKV